jgi:hypothetical protein
VPTRLVLSVVVLSVLLFTSGCGLFQAKTKVKVPQLLSPLTNASKNQLIQEINRLSTVKSIHGKVDIQFEDTSFAAVGVADRYRLVDGQITLQRPGKIYLIIQFGFVDIAQMTSDGEHFRVAVLKGNEKYKRFLKGTNSAVYPKLDNEAAGVADGKGEGNSQRAFEPSSATSDGRVHDSSNRNNRGVILRTKRVLSGGT